MEYKKVHVAVHLIVLVIWMFVEFNGLPVIVCLYIKKAESTC